MLGVATRIGHRMGLHHEAIYSKCSALEAEMRRRLWWSLMVFDARIAEMSNSGAVTFLPTWDCRPPSNVNDSDLQPEVKAAPAVQERPTEALLAVVRSEMADFVRHSAFFLDFMNPRLKSVGRAFQKGGATEGSEIVVLQKMIEDKYLRFCNPEIPLHFVAIWTARGYMAKQRLIEYWAATLKATAGGKQLADMPEPQRDAAVTFALGMLESDTKLLTSPLTKPYRWLMDWFQFPFPAYVHIIQELRRRPTAKYSSAAWQVMNENYEARAMGRAGSPFFKIFPKMILAAWSARCNAMGEQEPGNELEVPPSCVLDVQRIEMERKSSSYGNDSGLVEHSIGGESLTSEFDDFPMPFNMSMSLDSGPYDTMQSFDFGGQSQAQAGLESFPNVSGGPVVTDFDASTFDWMANNWNLGSNNTI